MFKKVILASAVALALTQTSFAGNQLALDEKGNLIINTVNDVEIKSNEKTLKKEKVAVEEKKADCNINYNDNNYTHITNDVAISYVVTNFVKGMNDVYADVNSIKNNIAKVYSFALIATPAIEKMNVHFNNRMQKKDFVLAKSTINKIEIVDAKEMKYKVHYTSFEGIMRDFATPTGEEMLKPHEKIMELTLTESPISTSKSTLVENNGIIIPKPNWSNNPFELWVKDFSITNLNNDKETEKDHK